MSSDAKTPPLIRRCIEELTYFHNALPSQRPIAFSQASTFYLVFSRYNTANRLSPFLEDGSLSRSEYDKAVSYLPTRVHPMIIHASFFLSGLILLFPPFVRRTMLIPLTMKGVYQSASTVTRQDLRKEMLTRGLTLFTVWPISLALYKRYRLKKDTEFFESFDDRERVSEVFATTGFQWVDKLWPRVREGTLEEEVKRPVFEVRPPDVSQPDSEWKSEADWTRPPPSPRSITSPSPPSTQGQSRSRWDEIRAAANGKDGSAS